MSDNAESPTETQKEEPQPPSDDSTTNDDKKKSKKVSYIENSTLLAINNYLFTRTVDSVRGTNSGCVTSKTIDGDFSQ